MRTPPHDEAAEQAVLGSMLLSQEALEGASAELVARDFFIPRHQTIFRAIVQSGVPDAVVVASTLGDDLPTVGGRAALLELSDVVSTAARWKHYAQVVHDCSVRRRVVESASAVMTAAYDGEDYSSPLSAISAADRTDSGAVRGDAVFARLDLTSRQEYIEHECLPGVHLRRGEVCVVGARPSVGKTALALQLARDWAAEGHESLFYGYEMSADSLVRRCIHAMTGFSRAQQDEGLAPQQVAFINGVMGQGALRHVRFDDTNPSLKRLIRQVYDFGRDGGRVVIIDYLQILVNQTTEEVTAASRAIKMAANDSRLVKYDGNRLVSDNRPSIVLLSQLNRGTVREDGTLRPPSLGDLRQSGAIEQDADIVALLHQYSDGDSDVRDKLEKRGYLLEFDWMRGAPPHKTLGHIDIAKYRDGETGMRPAWFSGADQCWQTLNRTMEGR